MYPDAMVVKVTVDPESAAYPAMLPLADNFAQTLRENIEAIMRDIRKSRFHQLEFNWPDAD